MGFRRRTRGTASPTRAARWFFATDVHGSDRCYRKFLAAARVYEADVLLLGGDVAGKGIVPLVERPDGRYTCTFHGETMTLSREDADAVRESIAFNGLYPYDCSQAEADDLHDWDRRAAVFDALISDQLRAWMTLTEERLGDDVRCIITPGNDDPAVVDVVLETARRVSCPERRLELVGPVRLASLGNTNRTPWATDREYDEDELQTQIDEMLTDVGSRDEPVVFNFHVPPYDTGLDTAAELDETLRPVVRGGNIVEIPVGSTAVYSAIERYRPVVALHGHIHESAGEARVGETRCFNPGSEYSSGVLRGVIVDFDESGQYLEHLFTSG
jgi:uncharacterized protein